MFRQAVDPPPAAADCRTEKTASISGTHYSRVGLPLKSPGKDGISAHPPLFQRTAGVSLPYSSFNAIQRQRRLTPRRLIEENAGRHGHIQRFHGPGRWDGRQSRPPACARPHRRGPFVAQHNRVASFQNLMGEASFFPIRYEQAAPGRLCNARPPLRPRRLSIWAGPRGARRRPQCSGVPRVDCPFRQNRARRPERKGAAHDGSQICWILNAVDDSNTGLPVGLIPLRPSAPRESRPPWAAARPHRRSPGTRRAAAGTRRRRAAPVGRAAGGSGGRSPCRRG